ncbi:MAG: MATE family efflux transporter [Lachnospiraceae bacterium]|nr:MATE family efflux transporter [Lachnospiraceae bacterium]
MELDMTKGSPVKLIFKFMLPLIVGNIFQQFYNMADTIIVGRAVGVQALAAVGATGTIMFLIIGFMQGLTTGFTVLTSQRFGAGDLDGLRKSVGNAAVLSIVVTVVMTVLSVAFMRPLLTLMKTPEDIFESAWQYITIICLGMGFTILYNLLSSILRAVGNSVVPLIFLVISAVLNIALDLVFILGCHLGVAGAAIATITAQAVSGILCLFYIRKKVPLLKLSKTDWQLDYYCVRNELSIGVPMALQFSITAVGTILVQVALNILGSTVVAAYTAAGKVEQLVTQPFVAMGMTMATYGGQNRGVNDLDRIRKGVKAANIISAVYAIVIAFVIVNTFQYVIRLFVSGEEVGQIMEYGKTYILICGSCFVPLGMIFIFRNILQGCGFSFWPMMGGVVELVSRCVMAFAAAQYKSYVGVCAANASAWLTAGIFLWIAYLFIMRKLLYRQQEQERKAAVSK